MRRKAAIKDSAAEFEQKSKRFQRKKYVLRLYVTGMTVKSKRAVQNIKKICEDHLKGRYHLEVIDIYREPVLAKGDQIIATPTLIKEIPTPLRKFIGDLSETEKILLGLDVRPKSNIPAEGLKSPQRQEDDEK